MNHDTDEKAKSEEITKEGSLYVKDRTSQEMQSAIKAWFPEIAKTLLKHPIAKIKTTIDTATLICDKSPEAKQCCTGIQYIFRKEKHCLKNILAKVA